jgi:hypothetical protein
MTLLFFVKRPLNLSVSMTFTTLNMEPAESSRMPLSMVQVSVSVNTSPSDHLTTDVACISSYAWGVLGLSA